MDKNMDESKTLVDKSLTKLPIEIINGNHHQQQNANDSKHKKDIERGKPFRQIIASFVANLGTINTGLIFGFSAVVLPQLLAPESSIQIDESQASWIASLSSAATPVGCILSGFLMDRVGRKLTLLVTEIPLILGWVTITTAANIPMIYIGRLLLGLGSGMVGAPSRVYTSEITQPHLRGMLSALASVGISFGVLLQYILGSFTSWKVLSGISAIVPLLAFTFMFFMPESPTYLVLHDHSDKAVKSLKRLRGSTYDCQEECHRLEEFANKIKAKSKVDEDKNDKLTALLSPATLKPFGILALYFFLYQSSGVNVITFYAVAIFQEAGSSFDKYTCTIILGVVRLVFTIVACIALRKVGRRPLSFISGIGCGSTMLGLGLYLYYKHTCDIADPPVQPSFTWFPVFCIYVFTITCTLGYLVVPWIMIGELYPQKVRGIAGGATTCVAHMSVFFVVKTYPFFTHLLMFHGVFIVYGLISFVATVFFYFYLPETKGKTLQEIENYFSKKTDIPQTQQNNNNNV